MSESLNHLPAERLQAYVEDSLDQAERAVVGSHLAQCEECRSEVEELRTLFESLSGLVYFSPSAGFADRVMTRVRVRQPWFARATEWLEGLMPHTTRGWAVATAVFALPLVGATVWAAWLMSQPGVTAQGLWTFLTQLVTAGASAGWQVAWAWISETTLANWVAAGRELAEGVGRGGMGLAVVMFATLTAASVWILYQNLFRPRARRNDYGSYVF